MLTKKKNKPNLFPQGIYCIYNWIQIQESFLKISPKLICLFFPLWIPAANLFQIRSDYSNTMFIWFAFNTLLEILKL